MSVLKGTQSFYDYDVSDSLLANLRSWLDYGLIEAGAYTVVHRDLATSGYTNLKKVKDGRSSNRVYEGLGPSWVWESGVSSVTNDEIFQVSGVYVNNTFYTPDSTGVYGHKIDYRNGRVIFNGSLPSNSVVQANYVMHDVAVYGSDSTQWSTIVNEYVSRFDNLDTLSPSGMASVLKDKRIWLPCVIIEVQDRTNAPLQLGGGEYNEFAVFYHIFADRPNVARKLADILNNQENKRLNLFNVNTSPFALNYDGTLASGALTYPQLSNRDGQYFWTYATIDSSRGGYRTTPLDVHRAEVIQSVTVARYLSTY